MKLPLLRIRFKKLNTVGAAHIIIPMLAVVGTGIIGTYLLVASHADSLSDRIQAGQSIAAGAKLTSTTGGYRINMQTDSNLVVYNASGTAIWNSGTYGKHGTRVTLQTDGNFVMYNASNVAVWSAQTSGTGATYAVMQSDGNFVLYKPGGVAVWSSKGGKVSAASAVAGSCTITGVPATTASLGSVTATVTIKNTGNTAFVPTVDMGFFFQGYGGSNTQTFASLAPGATRSAIIGGNSGVNWPSGQTLATWSATSTNPSFSCSAATHKA